MATASASVTLCVRGRSARERRGQRGGREEREGAPKGVIDEGEGVGEVARETVETYSFDDLCHKLTVSAIGKGQRSARTDRIDLISPPFPLGLGLGVHYSVVNLSSTRQLYPDRRDIITAHLMEQPTALWVRQHDFHTLLPLFQGLAHSSNRAPRPRARDKCIHRPIRLFPDLGARPLLMSSEVGEVLELVGEEAAWGVGVVR